jgi:histidyl-tRNA synthetase
MQAIELVSKLRNLGYATGYDINGRAISKQFHEAALKKAAAIIVINLDEYKKGIVSVKTESKEQKQNINEIDKYLDQLI